MPVDTNTPWTGCPLKQHIRENLWGRYIQKLKKKPVKYLTLYSTDLMDVKHFAKKGYIKFDDGVYKDVTGVNLPFEKDEITKGRGKLELRKTGYLHDLIASKNKELLGKFGFDVINLDYCNHIFGEIDTEYLSDNIEDITTIIEQQSEKNHQKFILFITTRTDKNSSKHRIGFAKNFLAILNAKIQSNISRDKSFKEKYNKVFNNLSPARLLKERYNDFVSLGIMKFIIMELADKGYGVIDSDIFWLIRNSGTPKRDLLHVALFVNRHVGIARKTLSQFGSLLYSERGATIILDKIDKKQNYAINELQHKNVFNDKYRFNIKELLEDSFELQTPEAISES